MEPTTNNKIESNNSPLDSINVTIPLSYYLLLQLKSRTTTREFCTVGPDTIAEIKKQSDDTIWKNHLHAEEIVVDSTTGQTIYNLWPQENWLRSIKKKDEVRSEAAEGSQLVKTVHAKKLHELTVGLIKSGYNNKQMESINRMHNNHNHDKELHEVDYSVLEAFLRVATALAKKNLDNLVYKSLLEGVVRPSKDIHNTLRVKMGLPIVELKKDDIDLDLV